MFRPKINHLTDFHYDSEYMAGKDQGYAGDYRQCDGLEIAIDVAFNIFLMSRRLMHYITRGSKRRISEQN